MSDPGRVDIDVLPPNRRAKVADQSRLGQPDTLAIAPPEVTPMSWCSWTAAMRHLCSWGERPTPSGSRIWPLLGLLAPAAN